MFKVVDLFSGAGGFSLAAKLLGLDVVGALEFEPYSCETYRKNLIKGKSKTVLVQEDITKISPADFMKRVGIKRGECDIIIGGPPCQGFSALQSNKDGNDPRNKLLWHYFDYVEAIQPKVFLVENVPGMLWEKNRAYVDKFYKLAKKSGYHVHDPQVLDAKSYGVPQTRKRVFIYGIRDDLKNFIDLPWPPEATHGDSDLFSHLKPWKTSSDIFGLPLSPNDPNNIHMQHSKELIEVFKSTPRNGGSRTQSKRVLACHLKHSGHKDVYGRIDPKKPGPTMTTSCTNPSKGRFVHPTKNHGITVRHAARFQTFPESFIFYGGIIAASRQIGNAVPIELGKATLRHLMNDLISLKSMKANSRASSDKRKAA